MPSNFVNKFWFYRKIYKDLAELGYLLANIVFVVQVPVEKNRLFEIFSACNRLTRSHGREKAQSLKEINKIEKTTLFMRI